MGDKDISWTRVEMTGKSGQPAPGKLEAEGQHWSIAGADELAMFTWTAGSDNVSAVVTTVAFLTVTERALGRLSPFDGVEKLQLGTVPPGVSLSIHPS